MNYEDRVTKSYIEDAIAGAGAKIVMGTYAGDGAASRTISLGFTPKAVLLVDMLGRMFSANGNYGGLALAGSPMLDHQSWTPCFTIVEGGFQVLYREISSGHYIRLNEPNATFFYLAIA